MPTATIFVVYCLFLQNKVKFSLMQIWCWCIVELWIVVLLKIWQTKVMFWIHIFNLLIHAGKGIAATKYFPQCFYYLVFRIFWLPPWIHIYNPESSILNSIVVKRQKILKVKKILVYRLRSWSMKPLKNVWMKASIFLCGIWMSVSGDCLNILCRS